MLSFYLYLILLAFISGSQGRPFSPPLDFGRTSFASFDLIGFSYSFLL